MYFKKLEISGFKSFAEKTILNFEPGITAIVGPNGCGKSNIFDAIRWCLGEQSIKSLRGSRMEDVIFNGTESIPAQNMTEVALTISNEAKILPIDYEEVTISRRLFRTGESEYLINNNPVRLKDVAELLMGTGIGAESYSLVEQGKIDLVISSRPEDRRLVFDEATGVSKYKAKKKEAMNKLEDTDNNLLRINDIITEVKRQIGSIERQASKARRYKEIFEKLKESELKFSGLELKALKSDMAMLAEIAKKSKEDELQLNNQLQALDGKQMIHQKNLQELDVRISELKDKMISLENANERNRHHIRLNHERIQDLNKHVDTLTSQKNQLKQRISGHEKSVAELNEQLLSLKENFCEKEANLKNKEVHLATLVEDIQRRQNQTQELKKRIFDINLKETQVSNQLNENASVLHSSAARLRRLQLERLKTEEEHRELKKNLEVINAEIAAQKDKINTIGESLGVSQREKSDLENTLKSYKDNLRGLEDEKLSLQSQIEFLKELKLKYDSMPQAKTGVLEIKEIPKEKITGIIAHARDVVHEVNTNTYRITCELKFISFDLKHLEARQEDISKEMNSLMQSISEKENQLQAVNSNAHRIEGELQKERLWLTNKEAVYINLSDNIQKIQEELSLIDLELVEVNEGLKTAEEKDEKLKSQLSQFKTEMTGIDTQMTENLNAINQNTSARENILVEVTQLKAELNNQKSKEESLGTNLNFFKDSLTQDNNALKICEHEVGESLSKIQDLKNEVASLDLLIKSNEEEVILKTKELNGLSQVRVEEVNSLDFIQEQIIDLEEKMDKVKEDNHQYQMQEQELHFKHANIKNRILQSYNIDLDETPFSEEAIGEVNMEQWTQEISLLKEKVKSFGTVNLVAIEELEELKNRFDFLTQQQNDLLIAKDSLQKAIIKINRTTRKMFLETFQIVAEEFKNYFRLLFGGGEARLFLIDEEDVLESGIEIICRPPGKKLQNITLLSGGEKALSAIALIFAIFKTKPSPFCVLDEIDAALDESNIDRFSRMLSDFAKTSQFIVITHNKRTIAIADVMYGITMEQSGISKIVSVKLRENGASQESKLTEKSRLSPEIAKTN